MHERNYQNETHYFVLLMYANKNVKSNIKSSNPWTEDVFLLFRLSLLSFNDALSFSVYVFHLWLNLFPDILVFS
jgi:hypothetical protein